MTKEAPRTESATKEFRQISKIDGPGKYRLSGHTYLPSFESSIPFHLRERTPGLTAISFHPATLIDGVYTPAFLERTNPEAFSLWQITAIETDGETYQIGGNSSSSNGHGESSFFIKDIGKLSVVKNKLVISRLFKRNGSLILRASGGVGHIHRWSPRAWEGDLTIEGQKPGKLITATVDILNDRIKDPNDKLYLQKEQ